ncbi:MAG: (2Fe-2S) ferredoxin domain-containing protein [Chloroflexales bacterium]|nr:(2Fe-2S) ferredoxin domain-containing protein [Chloroflexales bacterium]
MGKHDHENGVKVEELMRRGGPCLAVCGGKHCTRAGAKQVLRAAQAALDEAGLGETVSVILTKCQDYCDDGPAMTVLPGAYPYVELDRESARQVVLDHVRDGQPVLERLHKRARRKLERRLARAERE